MQMFIRRISTAKRPANPYCCEGCWMWRRKRVTLQFLDGGQKDIQCAQSHSWWITENGAWAIRPVDSARIYEKLLQPPKRFVLALMVNNVLSGTCPSYEKPGLLNQLHLMHANDVGEQTPRTQYIFTVNNIPHSYCPYELEEALREGNGHGMEPGVSALVAALGKRLIPEVPEREEVKPPTNVARNRKEFKDYPNYSAAKKK
jgi:hypothetical protein